MSCESNCRSRTCKDIQIVKLMCARLGFQEVREGAKKTRLFRGHVPYQGGGESTPFPSKFFFYFFRQNVINIYSACTLKSRVYFDALSKPLCQININSFLTNIHFIISYQNLEHVYTGFR